MIEELKQNSDLFVKIISYCIMPTHYHLLLEQVKDGGTEKFISKILNSYAKYFNLRHKRSGPLWSSRFKSVGVDDNEQLLHLTRYIHLNPTSAGYVSMPEDWQYSSYVEYISDDKYI